MLRVGSGRAVVIDTINSFSQGDLVKTRLEMLSILCDQFITTNAVRDDIQTEGAAAPEDHCRVCHRLGDMLICELCSGTFHPACLDPPVMEIPEDEWQCYVCTANEVQGVTDVASDQVNNILAVCESVVNVHHI